MNNSSFFAAATTTMANIDSATTKDKIELASNTDIFSSQDDILSYIDKERYTEIFPKKHSCTLLESPAHKASFFQDLSLVESDFGDDMATSKHLHFCNDTISNYCVKIIEKERSCVDFGENQ